MGLLDNLDEDQKAGLLQFGLSLMASKKRGLGGIGESGLFALQGMQNAKDSAMKRKLLESQIAENDNQAQAKTDAFRQKEELNDFMTPFTGKPLSMGGAGKQTGTIGPTNENANVMQNPNAPRLPTYQEAMQIKAMGGGDFKDYAEVGTKGVEQKGGSYYIKPMTGQKQYMPEVPKGYGMGDDGQPFQFRKFLEGEIDMAGGVAGAKKRAEMPFNILENQWQQYYAATGDAKEVFNPDTKQMEFDNRANITGMRPPQGLINPSAPQSGRMPSANDMAKILAYEKSQGNNVDLNNTSFNFQGGMENPAAPKRYVAKPDPIDQARLTKEATLSPDYSADFNKQWVNTDFADVKKSGGTAKSMLNSISALRNLDLETGFGGVAKEKVGSVLSGFGIASENIAKYTSSAQSFLAVVGDAALTKTALQKGTATNEDAKRIDLTLPKLTNTKEANAFVMDYVEALANAEVKKQEYYQKAFNAAQKDKISNLGEIDERWMRGGYSIWNDPAMQKWKKYAQ
jgi:hypothetical protein